MAGVRWRPVSGGDTRAAGAGMGVGGSDGPGTMGGSCNAATGWNCRIAHLRSTPTSRGLLPVSDRPCVYSAYTVSPPPVAMGHAPSKSRGDVARD